jgi:thiamine-triphosphatase
MLTKVSRVRAVVNACTSHSLGKPTSIYSASLHARGLEVEHKFIVTPPSLAYLQSNSGVPKFKKHENLGNKTYHDIYYDRQGCLFAKGVYIRKRNGEWEAKSRTGGDFVNSALAEVHSSRAVRDTINQNLFVIGDGRVIEEVLSPCAEFLTKRQSSMINGKFQVDVDTTNFGHRVGEVELTRDLGGIATEPKEVEEHFREEMDTEISDFMQMHR